MATLTIKRARKILGKLADNISDEDLLNEIKTAELLKTLFFSNFLDSRNSSIYTKNNHESKNKS